MTRPRALGSGSQTVVVRKYVRGHAPAAEPADAPLASFVRRWWLLLFLGSLLGLALGYAYSRVGPTSFQSTALLQVRADASSTRPATDAQIAAIAFATEAIAPSILDHVSQALAQNDIHISTPELLTMSQTNKLTSQPVKGSSAITIQATHENPAIAQAIADKVAQTAVDDTAAQAQGEANQRTRTIQDELDRTRAEMQGAQLYQREQDLQQRLQTEQAELVQLQNGFTQTLQQQVQIALALRQQTLPTPQPPSPTVDQQRQLNTLSATAAQALNSEVAMLTEQQNTARQAVNDADTQLAAVRDELTKLPDPNADPATATNPDGSAAPASVDVAANVTRLQQQQAQIRDQMGQEQQLEKQEHDLQVQSTDLHNQQRSTEAQMQQMTLNQQSGDQQRQQQQQSLQDQIQAEMNQQGLLKANIDAIVPLKGQTDLNNQQQVQLQSTLTQLANSRAKLAALNGQIQQLQQTSGGGAATTDASVKLLQQQLQAAQQASASTDAQLKDVTSRRAALQQTLGPNPGGTIESLGEQVVQLQQHQHDQDQTSQRAQSRWVALKQQESDLLRQKQNAQDQLLQAQRELQADIQRQADVNQRDIQAQVTQSSQAAPAAPPEASLPTDLLDNAGQQRDQLMGQIRDQQQQLSASTAALSAQLDEVHQAQAALPVKLDPAQAAVLATVDAQKLSQLSQEYTRLLIDQATGVGPLERFGPAAPATAAGGQLRMLPLGAAGGLALAAFLAFLLQLVLGRFRRRSTRPPTMGVSPNGHQLASGRRATIGAANLARSARSYSAESGRLAGRRR